MTGQTWFFKNFEVVRDTLKNVAQRRKGRKVYNSLAAFMPSRDMLSGGRF